MYKNIIKSRSIPLWMRTLSTVALLYGGQSSAADNDYFVFLSNSVDNSPAGTISHGLNDIHISPSHDDACGVLIKSVDEIAWFFYEGNSSPPIETETLNKDVKVFLPLPGCGNNGQVRININGVDKLPQGGAADYVLLLNGSSFTSIDKLGNPFMQGPGVSGSQVPDFLNKPHEPPYMKVIASTIAQIKAELLTDDPQRVLPARMSYVSDYARTRSALLNNHMADVNRSGLVRDSSQVNTDRALVQHMALFQTSMDRCLSHYYESEIDMAYVQCDIAKQQIESIISRQEK